MDFAKRWESFLTPRDLDHLRQTGHKTKPFGFGTRPALLVVDDYYSVLGLEREPILESVKNWPMSCGLEGWEAIDKTVDLVAGARDNGIPVIYLRGFDGVPNKPLGYWGRRITSPPRERRGLDHLPPEAPSGRTTSSTRSHPVPTSWSSRRQRPAASTAHH